MTSTLGVAGGPPAPVVRDRPRTLSDAVSAYRPDDFFLRTPTRCLLARGRQAELRADVARESLARHAILAAWSDAVAGGPGLVVGAIPFSPSTRTRLHIPESAWSLDVAPGGAAPDDAAPEDAKPPEDARPEEDAPGHAASPDRPAAHRSWRVQPVPPAGTYETAVDAALRRIATGEVQKVVLARALDVLGDELPDPASLLTVLMARRSGHYTFAVPLGGARTLLGASPELLVSRSGSRVSAHPLAGSVPRSADPVVDRQRRDALARSEKDHREHAIVVDALAESLRPWCSDLTVPAEPAVLSTPTMWHLGTRITGTLADPETTSLQLALATHPTPAVCGTPVAAAREVIAELEPFDRGFFAGTVGWMDASGDGEWAVTLRCAEAEGTRVRLYAGAGIVAGSIPRDEAIETQAKFGTMLDALGIDR